MNNFEFIPHGRGDFVEYAIGKLDEGCVIIRVAAFKDNSISVASIAQVGGGLYMVYFPVHCENSYNGRSFVDIWDESTGHYEPDELATLLEDLYEYTPADWYISDDRANFYGPLECEAATLWLEEHPGYHVNSLEDLRRWRFHD